MRSLALNRPTRVGRDRRDALRSQAGAAPWDRMTGNMNGHSRRYCVAPGKMGFPTGPNSNVTGHALD
jgi:hypothetical protein